MATAIDHSVSNEGPEFFRELERTRTSALVDRDLALAWRLHAADYQLVTPSGRTFTRDRYLGMIESGAMNYGLWQLDDIAVRLQAGMAIVRYQATLAFRSTSVSENGLGAPFKCWHTDSYERIDGSWQAVWSQATKII